MPEKYFRPPQLVSKFLVLRRLVVGLQPNPHDVFKLVIHCISNRPHCVCAEVEVT